MRTSNNEYEKLSNGAGRQGQRRKRTPNTQRRTLNFQRSTRSIQRGRVREDAGDYSKKATLNAQRSTRTVQVGDRMRFNLEERLLDFSARIIRLIDSLPNTRAANHLAGQLLRSGTSPYGNHGEVQAAESRRDFIHKLSICLKELKETRRWLRLVARSEIAPERKMDAILGETEELIKIFFTSIRTAERNGK